MGGKILSIIIPSYNVSKYIDDVLPSYIEEKLFPLMDIILIDDGATDDTQDKVLPYIKKYPGYFHFYHKDNGGHGSVINYGVHNIVKTKYFKVIDGDDWVYPKALLQLAEYLTSSDEDLIISDCSYEYKDHQSISYGIRKTNGLFNLRIHNITFKTKIFKDHNIFVREKVFYEDSQYVLYPLEYVRTIKYLPGVVARYRQDEPSQSVNPQVQLRRKEQYEIVSFDLLEYVNKVYNDNSVRNDLKKFILDSVTRIVFGAFELNWSYSLKTKEAIQNCRKINKVYKKNYIIYKQLVHNYKRFRQMRFANFNGIRFARLFHRAHQ